MKRAALLALVLTPLSAHAAPRIDRYKSIETEARSWLMPCHAADAANQGLCEQNQFDFVEQYVFAALGDYLAAGSTAASFSTLDVGHAADRLGMPHNQVEACAWSIVRDVDARHSAIDDDAMQRACHALPLNQRLQAIKEAKARVGRIRAHAIPMPPPDWEPATSVSAGSKRPLSGF